LPHESLIRAFAAGGAAPRPVSVELAEDTTTLIGRALEELNAQWLREQPGPRPEAELQERLLAKLGLPQSQAMEIECRTTLCRIELDDDALVASVGSIALPDVLTPQPAATSADPTVLYYPINLSMKQQ
jgi:hypothetical protein